MIVLKLLKVVLPLLVLAGAGVGANALIESREEPKPRPKERNVPAVVTATAVRERVRLSVTTYGTVRPRTQVSIVPQVSGRVVHLSPSLREGGFFEKDDVLVRIERRDYELAVTQAEALVAQAEARLDREEAEARVAKREWERYGKGEPNALVLREPQLAEARANLASAKARLEKARLDLTRTEIGAPCDGRVLSESVDEGQFVTVGAPLAVVYSTEYAEVRLSIPDDQLGFLDLPLDFSAESGGHGAEGNGAMPVTLTSVLGGREYEWSGEVVRTEARVDPKTRVIHTLARVRDPYARRAPGQPPLMVGMYVTAVIPGREADCVVVPRAALRGRDGVLVVTGEGRIRVRRVEVLTKDSERVLTTRGIEAGERVCVTEVHPLVDGMEVRAASGGGGSVER